MVLLIQNFALKIHMTKLKIFFFFFFLTNFCNNNILTNLVKHDIVPLYYSFGGPPKSPFFIKMATKQVKDYYQKGVLFEITGSVSFSIPMVFTLKFNDKLYDNGVKQIISSCLTIIENYMYRIFNLTKILKLFV